MNTAMKNNGD